MAIQFALALLLFKTDAGRLFFVGSNKVILGLLECSDRGARFVFGELVGNYIKVGNLDPASHQFSPTANLVANTATIFAFEVLPTIVFFGALLAVLYYFGIMQRVVYGIAWLVMKTLGTSGPETTFCAGSIFFGQSEAPFLIKPYLEKLTKSELFAIMCGGFATIAGSVMAAYVALLKDDIPNIAGALMTASIMAMPGALMLAKMMYPETEKDVGLEVEKIVFEKHDTNMVDAASKGCLDGLRVALNVGAMLIGFIALMTLLDKLLHFVGVSIHSPELSLEWLLGKALAPLAYLLGFPWKDCQIIGDLLGTKLILTEFVAYIKLKGVSALLDPKTRVMVAFALCGFANVGSIGIQIGTIGGLAPQQRPRVAQLAWRALLVGSLANCETAAIVGLFF